MHSSVHRAEARLTRTCGTQPHAYLHLAPSLLYVKGGSHCDAVGAVHDRDEALASIE